jgi:hypothetical protein
LLPPDLPVLRFAERDLEPPDFFPPLFARLADFAPPDFLPRELPVDLPRFDPPEDFPPLFVARLAPPDLPRLCELPPDFFFPPLFAADRFELLAPPDFFEPPELFPPLDFLDDPEAVEEPPPRFPPDEPELFAPAARPTAAPITPPTTAPTGPATLPRTAPAAAPAVCLEIGGISMFSDDELELSLDCWLSCSAIRYSPLRNWF